MMKDTYIHTYIHTCIDRKIQTGAKGDTDGDVLLLGALRVIGRRIVVEWLPVG